MDVSTGRRGFLVGTGLAGAGAVLGNGTAAAGAPRRRGRGRRDDYVWLAGDHHVHTRYSNDAMYPVATQVERAATYGLDWLVITDHGNVPFATHSIPSLVSDIVAARRKHRDDVLVFTGLEWNSSLAAHTRMWTLRYANIPHNSRPRPCRDARARSRSRPGRRCGAGRGD